MTYSIVWKGNVNTNSSDRGAHIPFAVVNHISAGTMAGMDAWFTSPDNRVSSAHFGVARDGRIHQYVAIERMAWANGATPDSYAPADRLAPVVADNYGVNPNLYTVSIEHEGYALKDADGRITEMRGLDGALTEEQFAATVWLHRYIRDEIVRIYGPAAWFPLDAYHVIGHYQIARSKPLCPGPAFPWTRLYAALEGGEETMKLTLTTEEWGELALALDALYRKGKLGNYAWVTKASRGEITRDQLEVVRMIALANA